MGGTQEKNLGKDCIRKQNHSPDMLIKKLSVREEPETDSGILCMYTIHTLLVDKCATRGLEEVVKIT